MRIVSGSKLNLVGILGGKICNQEKKIKEKRGFYFNLKTNNYT